MQGRDMLGYLLIFRFFLAELVFPDGRVVQAHKLAELKHGVFAVRVDDEEAVLKTTITLRELKALDVLRGMDGILSGQVVQLKKQHSALLMQRLPSV